MRRIIVLIAFAFVIGGGSVYVSAQSGNDANTEEVDIGADAAGCATPLSSPEAGEITDLLATAVASPAVTDSLATAIASPDATSGATPLAHVDLCATPSAGTPVS